MDPDPSDNTEILIKVTRPQLPGDSLKKDGISSTYDLMEQMQYLYVRVVKARDMAVLDGVELVAQVKLGNYSGTTKPAALSKTEWNQVFALSKEYIPSSTVEIIVTESNKGDHLGRVWFDLSNVPSRVPADCELAPQWYRMEWKTGDIANTGEILISIWFGTQDDKAFAEAWHCQVANVPSDVLSFIEPKVYRSPKLWYLRVSVLEAEHIMPGHREIDVVRFPEFFARVLVGNQHQKTQIAAPSNTRSFSNPCWNQDLLFVVEEPFADGKLHVSVVDRVGPLRNVVVATAELPLAEIQNRIFDNPVDLRWLVLESQLIRPRDNSKPSKRFVAQISLQVSIDGGYHVFDELPMNSSDFRPSDTRLWKPPIGVLEVRILGASGFKPVKTNDSSYQGHGTNAYCIARYGQEWCRTRTVVDSSSPEWNEQYNWQVYDICTVMTIGVFDNCKIGNPSASDDYFGKVRIRLSTLEIDNVYTHSYPLLVFGQSGIKNNGELHLVMKLSCSNVADMLLMYTMPLLPKMHYVFPLTVIQLDALRNQAKNLLASRLSREEPPLGREVVEYMLGDDRWNMRRSKANLHRITDAYSTFVALGRSLQAIANWQKPAFTVLAMFTFLTALAIPEIIAPVIIAEMVFFGIWYYRFRPRHPPPQMSTKLCGENQISPDELDEEFDTFPTSHSMDIVRMSYDRLRVRGDIVGDLTA